MEAYYIIDYSVVYEPVTSDGTPTEEAEFHANPAPNLRRQLVNYPTRVAAGTVIIDTAQTYLYFVLGDDTAIRYGIGVGRDGFRWSGEQTVTRKSEWPDWVPPQEMIERQRSEERRVGKECRL